VAIGRAVRRSDAATRWRSLMSWGVRPRPVPRMLRRVIQDLICLRSDGNRPRVWGGLSRPGDGKSNRSSHEAREALA